MYKRSTAPQRSVGTWWAAFWLAWVHIGTQYAIDCGITVEY